MDPAWRERDVRTEGDLRLVTRHELSTCPHWQTAFSDKLKDRRYYELLEDTVREGYDYRYFAVENSRREIFAVQPFFLLHQDIVAGVPSGITHLVAAIRRLWPSFLMVRTLMVGCVAGAGHLDGGRDSGALIADILAASIVSYAGRLKARLIVLKEFPASYRKSLHCFLAQGFTRIPSMPMTVLNIEYANYEDYMRKALGRVTRRKLRQKFRAAARAAPIELSIVTDVSAIVDEIYPLYVNVYNRSTLHFEKLTKEYFGRIGSVMQDKVLFFLWRQSDTLIAFTLCMIEGQSFYAEYIGLDYRVALELHLYHYAVRDMISWAIANDFKWFRSSALNYDPKLHFRHRLDPIDLYVRHTSPLMNAVLRYVLPLIEPTRYDETLKKFPNYRDLWAQH